MNQNNQNKARDCNSDIFEETNMPMEGADMSKDTSAPADRTADEDAQVLLKLSDVSSESKKHSFSETFSKIKEWYNRPRVRRTWRERTLKERLVTLIPTLIMFILFVCSRWQSDVDGAKAMGFYYSIGILAASMLVGVFCVRLGRVWGWIVAGLAPAASFFLTEMFTQTSTVKGQLLFVNIMLYYLGAAFILFLTGSLKATVAIVSLLPMLYGGINYYVLQFRGTPFFPWDIASAGIAADVVGNYEFVISWHVCFLFCAFLFIAQLGFLCTPRIRLKMWWLRVPAAILASVCILSTASFIQSDEGLSKLKMYPYLFSPKTVYNRNGTAVTFIYTLQFADLEKPEGYSVDKLEAVLDEYEAESVENVEKLPNVIVVMNEAFSDLKTMVDYKENEPVTPYIDSMSDDTVKGTLHVSVKGGNTANSEFEFLTGLSMANMTPGSIPYQQYVNGETPTFVSQMKELGYKTVGMHPYGATGWNRDKVYEWFGFDEAYFMSSFDGAEKIRNYYSDRATYEKIIGLYENKTDDQPLFVFDVTMQNHGGYSTMFDNLKTSLHVGGISNNGSVNMYLSLVNKSDEAFGELVEYFKTQDEPTVILLFGDHQPHDSYVKPLLKLYDQEIESGTMEEQLRRYTVPFVMWANYDIEEKSDIHTSINYLSTMLCETAGIPRTSTQMYLADLMKTYPVITEGLFSDAEGNYHSAAEMDSIAAFNEYKMLSYNMISDTKHTLDFIYSYK